MKPLVSVIMPVYNTAAYVAEAVESVLAESYPHWELLCLDDGSTDDSRAIVAQFARRDSRVRSVPLPHQGIVGTMNEGVRQAEGELIARLDADDIALPERFQQQVDYLNAQPELALLGGAYRTIDAAGTVWKTNHAITSPAEIWATLQRGNCLCHSTVMMRRTVLDELPGPYREHFPLAEDYDLWLRIGARYAIANLPECLIHYRRDLSRVNPQRLATQAIATLGALHSANARAAGKPDPAEMWRATDRDTLIREGIPAATIDKQVRRYLLSDARLAKKRGFRESAKQLLSHAAHYAPRGEGWASQFDYLWRSLRVQLAR